MVLHTFFRRLLHQTQGVFSRFPLSMIVIAVGFALFQYTIWGPVQTDDTLMKLNLSLWTVLPLITSVAFFKLRKWILLLALVLGLLFYSQLDLVVKGSSFTPFLWAVAFYSALLFLPRWKKQENNGFWNYSAHLAFILALGMVCSLILALSLQLALFSVEMLFDLSFDPRWSPSIWQTAFTLVLPIFVHVGLPEDYKALAEMKHYPDFLRPVSYYLLLPISGLYFLILGAYLLKIFYTQVWPSGEVAYPVLYLCLLVFGTYYLSYPWQKAWQRWSFLLLLPFLTVYFLALVQRIEQYGFTEMRYLGVLLGILLALSCFYYYASARKRLQQFFLSLAVFSFIFAFGPWSALEVSVWSQKGRLENLLYSIGALEPGSQVMEVRPESVDDDTVYQISSIVGYLKDKGQLAVLQEWTDLDLDNEAGDMAISFVESMGLTFRYGWEEPLGQNPLFFQYHAGYDAPLTVSDYDLLFAFDLFYDQYTRQAPQTASRSFTLGSGQASLTLRAEENGDLILSMEGSSDIRLSLKSLKSSLDTQSFEDPLSLDYEQLVVSGENETIRMKIYLESFDGELANDGTFLRFGLFADLLVDWK